MAHPDDESFEDDVDVIESSDDDDEEEEEEKVQVKDDGPSKKKRKLDYRPPTNDEMMRLKETENLFKNNLFRLQIEELLKEVTVDFTKMKPLEQYLHKLKTHLEALPKAEVSAKKVAKLSGVHVPACDRTPVFAFEKPAVHVIGSFLCRTTAIPETNIDLALEMPADLFNEKDYLNHRYSAKRSLYLAHVAAALKKQKGLCSSVSVTGFVGDASKPVLVIKPVLEAPSKVSKKFVIRLFPMIGEDVFRVTRLLPDRNNVKQADSDENAVATPHYNNGIVEDMLFKRQLEELHNAIGVCPVLTQSIKLFKIWLRRRGMTQSSDSINGFVLSMLLVHMLNLKMITRHMSAYQVFRVALEYIESTDWASTGLEMSPGTTDVELFQSAFSVVFLDSSGRLNLTGRMSPGAYTELKSQATSTLKVLNGSDSRAFDITFMTKFKFLHAFDNYISIPVPESYRSTDVHSYELQGSFGRKCTEVMQRALTDRTVIIRECPRASETWPLDQAFSQPTHTSIGLCLDSKHALRMVDMGPSAENAEESASYRQFWGDKSELRRFKDGSIVESVVWEEFKAKRSAIVENIVKYSVSRHLEVEVEEMVFTGSNWDTMLQEDGIDSACYANLLQATFDELCKNIREIDLPLAIRNLSSVSPAFRGTEVFPPIPHSLADASKSLRKVESKVTESLLILLEFELSTRWPDELDAIQEIKRGFYLKIAEGLKNAHEMKCIVTLDSLQVFFGGYVFEVKIFYEKEQMLEKIQQRVDGNESDPKDHKLTLQQQAAHANLVHGFHMKNASYSQTVRLALRWLNAHMLSDFVKREAVELIVGFMYMQPHPHLAPRSEFSGFLRFLFFLAEFDWAGSPLIVDLNEEIDMATRNSIVETFQKASRETLPAMFLATGTDVSSMMFTRPDPSSQMLRRMIQFARSSATTISSMISSSSNLSTDDWKVVFSTPVKGYDAVIHLKSNVVPHNSRSVSGKKTKSVYDMKRQYKNLATSTSDLLVNFDPVKSFVTELKDRYKNTAIFFHDQYGCGAVYAIFYPKPLQPAPFKLSTAAFTKPLPGKDKKPGNVVLNVDEVCSDIEMLGEGLVEKVVLLRDLTA